MGLSERRMPVLKDPRLVFFNRQVLFLALTAAVLAAVVLARVLHQQSLRQEMVADNRRLGRGVTALDAERAESIVKQYLQQAVQRRGIFMWREDTQLGFSFDPEIANVASTSSQTVSSPELTVQNIPFAEFAQDYTLLSTGDILVSFFDMREYPLWEDRSDGDGGYPHYFRFVVDMTAGRVVDCYASAL